MGNWRRLFNVGLKEKKFGLEQALILISKRPEISKDHALVVTAAMEAVGIPDVVVAEAVAAKENLVTSMKEVQVEIAAAEETLVAIENEGQTVLQALRERVAADIKRVLDAAKAKAAKIQVRAADKVRVLSAKIYRIEEWSRRKAADKENLGVVKEAELKETLEKMIQTHEQQILSRLEAVRIQMDVSRAGMLADKKYLEESVQKVLQVFTEPA